MFLEEERPQNGGGDYQKDTGSEPRTGSFTRVGVARTELLNRVGKGNLTLSLSQNRT